MFILLPQLNPIFLIWPRVNTSSLHTYVLTFLEITFYVLYSTQDKLYFGLYFDAFSITCILHVKGMKSSFFYRWIWSQYCHCVLSSSSGHFLPAPSRRGLCHWSHSVCNCRSLFRLIHPSSHWWSHRVESVRYKTYTRCCPLDNTCEFLRDIQAGFLKKSSEFRVSKGRMLNIFIEDAI